jgi:hypothetical protein
VTDDRNAPKVHDLWHGPAPSLPPLDRYEAWACEASAEVVIATARAAEPGRIVVSVSGVEALSLIALVAVRRRLEARAPLCIIVDVEEAPLHADIR